MDIGPNWTLKVRSRGEDCPRPYKGTFPSRKTGEGNSIPSHMQACQLECGQNKIGPVWDGCGSDSMIKEMHQGPNSSSKFGSRSEDIKRPSHPLIADVRNSTENKNNMKQTSTRERRHYKYKIIDIVHTEEGTNRANVCPVHKHVSAIAQIATLLR